MQKKLLSILLIAVLILGSLAGCGGGAAEEPAAAETIKIGINYELSGPVATYGQSSVDGIMMAFDEINAAGGIDGKMIEPVQADNKSEASEATSVATKLITQAPKPILVSIGAQSTKEQVTGAIGFNN